MGINEYCGRFAFSSDMNGDLAFTISDVWLMAKFAWLLPAKLVVGGLHSFPELATFFEVSCSTGEGIGGAVFSLFAWALLFGLIATIQEAT